MLDGPSLDLLSHVDDALTASEVDVGGGEVVESFVIAAVIVVVDEASDGSFEIAGQVGVATAVMAAASLAFFILP